MPEHKDIDLSEARLEPTRMTLPVKDRYGIVIAYESFEVPAYHWDCPEGTTLRNGDTLAFMDRVLFGAPNA